ncbi:HPP family protein [Vibrio cyclitrophicus]|uniref:HPP family protein n=1 Tax=Vibrio cyclitrophicus TaxID=47951 RepID=UPI000299E04B|nr:HPP family protein [Vibrio cyclitrophicus]OEE24304.1 hypothetical protein OAM_17215 [Vibrio cyclitrophicus ZF14]
MKKNTPFAVTSGFAATLTILGMGAISQLSSEWALIMAPFGASCVIVFGLPNSPLAQTKNIVFGHLLTSMVGLSMLTVLGNTLPSLALGVGLGIMLMQLTDTTHPPAGANPLLIVLTDQQWPFLFQTVLPGSLCLVLAAYSYKQLNDKLSQSQRGFF